jgi:hypothetical protein
VRLFVNLRNETNIVEVEIPDSAYENVTIHCARLSKLSVHKASGFKVSLGAR